AFSWITRLADVCRTKIVHRPSASPLRATRAATSSVISCRPRPRVRTESRDTRPPNTGLVLVHRQHHLGELGHRGHHDRGHAVALAHRQQAAPALLALVLRLPALGGEALAIPLEHALG